MSHAFIYSINTDVLLIHSEIQYVPFYNYVLPL